MLTYTSKDIQYNKKAENSTRSRTILSRRLSCFYRLYIEQHIPRPVNTKRKRKAYYSGKKKRHTAVKTQVMVNPRSIIIHKTGHKKGRRGMTMILIKIIILLLQNKLLIYLIQDTLLAQKRISQDKTSSIPKRKKRKSIGLSQEEINFN